MFYDGPKGESDEKLKRYFREQNIDMFQVYRYEVGHASKCADLAQTPDREYRYFKYRISS